MTWLIINPEKLDIGIGPKGNVFVRLCYPHEQTGLLPGVDLAIEMSPAQARELASQSRQTGSGLICMT